MNDSSVLALDAVLHRCRSLPSLARIVHWLERHTDSINTQLADAVIAEIPAFTASRNPEILRDLAEHAPQHTGEIKRLLGGGEPGDFQFVRQHARRRAEQRFPLEATLHAYRCGHKVFTHKLSDAIRQTNPAPDEAAAMLGTIVDFTLEYTDVISTAFASAYVAEVQLLADIAGDQHAQLMALLLDGYDEADRRIADILRDAGYLSGRVSFCVALAQSVDAAEMQHPDRARRLAESVNELFRHQPYRRLVDFRDNRVAIIFSVVRRVSGWTKQSETPSTSVSRRLALLGNAVRIGVSSDVGATSHVPRAYRQALHAFHFSDHGSRVVHFPSIPLPQLLQHMAGDELRHVLPHWADALASADERSRGTLSTTLRAYADADMNVLRTAGRLTLHPNTVYARFARITVLTGLEPNSYHALSELLCVFQALERQRTRVV